MQTALVEHGEFLLYKRGEYLEKKPGNQESHAYH
jgi:hypothetical protein